MDHVKTKLQKAHDQREAESGMPKGKGKAGGKHKGNLDYYLAKGEAPEDVELAKEYFEAKEKQEKNANMFSDILYSADGKTVAKG